MDSDATSTPVLHAEPLFRRAVSTDVADIVRLLADDALGARREKYVLPLPESYYHAFAAIDRDPNNELIVVELSGKVVGVLHYAHSAHHLSGKLARADRRRPSRFVHAFGGVGRKLFAWAIERARGRAATCCNSTWTKHAWTPLLRNARLASHEGLKLHLAAPADQPA
jgi:hypothetical protein